MNTIFSAKFFLALAGEPLNLLSAPKAYLDPGSGSFILQLLLAALLGGLFIIKGYWMKIKTFFVKIIHKQVGPEEDDE